MRLLVDAHALLWWLGADRRLSPTARETIEAAQEPLLSAGTLIEIAVKRSLGKLEVDKDWPEQASADGFDVLAIGWSHATCLQDLPFPRLAGKSHRDPFDRLLAAQALCERIPIVTRAPAFAAYGVATIW
jgi:PIN domain nuclease of toxin-antitoxin system